MYRKKVYGESRIDNCPFCGRRALTKNSEGVPVCADHKNKSLPRMKCVCGEPLDVMEGKWGAYFNCINCGNISFRKGLDMNPPIEQEKPKDNNKKEITISSRDVDVFYS